MLRKNVAPVVATILCGLLFVVVGSCFSAFLYKKEIIKVDNPKIVKSEDVVIFDSEGNKEIEEIKLSQLKLGLKPATGEEDVETNIPSTITTKKGSEGQYGVFCVSAPKGAKISIVDINIQNKKDNLGVNDERKNIMVAIKELSGSAASLSNKEVDLGQISASNDKVKLTIHVWLSGKAENALKSSTISFKIKFTSLI